MVTACTSLEALSLRHCNNLTHEGFIGIAPHCKSLTRFTEMFLLNGVFNMNGPSLTSMAGHCPLLKVYLSMGTNQLSDSSIESLVKNCQFLQEISLGENTVLTDNAFAHWPVHEHLKKVNFPLKNSSISDGAVGFVVDRCPNLHMVGLKSPLLSNKSFQHLVRSTKLKNIELGYNEGFTRPGIEQFLAKRKIQRISLPFRTWGATEMKAQQFTNVNFVFF